MSILIIGSSNTDMVIQAHHLPAPGETLLGGQFMMVPGGKGANQAVAAARLGGEVCFITKIGNDIFGRQALENFQREGIDITHCITDAQEPSGVALITVDREGENTIVVASGSNSTLYPDDIPGLDNLLDQSQVLLLQLEIPVETVELAVAAARQKKVTVILNPAPARQLEAAILKNIDILTPNETEASMLTGITVSGMESAKQAAQALQSKGVHTVIITLGANGALLLSGDEFEYVPAPTVQAVDTTAAGDVFSGALAVAIARHVDIREAVSFACRAASLSVTRMGAQRSIPYVDEL